MDILKFKKKLNTTKKLCKMSKSWKKTLKRNLNVYKKIQN